jgi:GNAT superfamily N-acetyltransferase
VNPTVRPLKPRDFDAWLPLWDGYNSFYRNDVTAEVTENTFRRLNEGADGFFGLVFVARPHRGSGAARALIEGVYAEADRRGADSVYWHTQSYNAPARSLYDQVAQPTSFVVYER